METNLYLVITAFLYKVMSLGVGALSIYLGYKLFSKGIWGNSGDLTSSFKDFKLVLRSAAPGSFFSVLGAVIVCFTIVTGFSASNEEGDFKVETQVSEEEVLKEFKSTKDKPVLN